MNKPILIRPVQTGDAEAWKQMRQSLWPSPLGEHETEMATFFEGKGRNPAEVLLAFDALDQPIGFAELSIRNYAEACLSDRVAYLEGWYVEPHARRQFEFPGKLLKAGCLIIFLWCYM